MTYLPVTVERPAGVCNFERWLMSDEWWDDSWHTSNWESCCSTSTNCILWITYSRRTGTEIVPTGSENISSLQCQLVEFVHWSWLLTRPDYGNTEAICIVAEIAARKGERVMKPPEFRCAVRGVDCCLLPVGLRQPRPTKSASMPVADRNLMHLRDGMQILWTNLHLAHSVKLLPSRVVSREHKW